MKKIAIIGSQASYLINFRGSLIGSLVARGYIVYASAPDFDEITLARLQALGAIAVKNHIARTGMNPFVDIYSAFSLCCMLRKIRPDVVVVYSMKPVIYGAIAAVIAGVRKRFVLVEGLGYIFADRFSSFKQHLLNPIVTSLFRIALLNATKVFVLNDQDKCQLLEIKAVKPDQIAKLDGIGVDLQLYTPAPPVLHPVTFMFAARMIREKGVYEFVEAARKIKSNSPLVRFLMVGGADANPNSITREELAAWNREGVIECIGWVTDIRPWMARSSVFVLPSYYREGLPRVSQEALAMGRPVITTDWIGCRETVTDGYNGFLIPIRDVDALVFAMRRFIENPSLILSMGAASRAVAEARFDDKKISATMVMEMEL